MTYVCVCGCPKDEHDGDNEDGQCILSLKDKKHLCGGYEDNPDAE